MIVSLTIITGQAFSHNGKTPNILVLKQVHLFYVSVDVPHVVFLRQIPFYILNSDN
jgi:hypothetical protein